MFEQGEKNMKLLYLALVALIATSTNADAGDVFATVTSRTQNVFSSVRKIVFVVGGFGLVGLAIGAIFGAVKWKWLAALAMGLCILAVANAVVKYATGSGEVGVADTLS